MRCFFYQNGYWEDQKDNEPLPEGAVPIPKQPSRSHYWDGTEWKLNIKSADLKKSCMVEQELNRLVKFHFLEEKLFSIIQDDLKEYENSLREYVKRSCEGNMDESLPKCPESLYNENFYML